MAREQYYRRPLSVAILLAVNALTLLLSIVVLAEGIWLHERHYDDCSRNMQWFVISIGIIMFVLSLLGYLGAKRGRIGLLWLYIALLTIVIILLIIFTIFAFLLKHHGFATIFTDSSTYVPSSLLHRRDCNPDFLFHFKRDWGTMATTSLIVLLLLLVLYSLACSAFMHALNRRVFQPGFV